MTTPPQQMGRTGKVLVLGDDTRAFLSIVRSLGRRDLEVHIGWSSAPSPALRSRHVSRSHTIPPYSLSDDSWKTSLAGILRDEQFDLVIPCNDRTLVPLQRHRVELEQLAVLAIPNDDAFEVTFDKLKTTDRARELGLPVPRSTRVSSVDEADSILAAYELPVVVKPQSSFSLATPESGNRVRKAYDADGLERHLRVLLTKGDVLVQEHFTGVGVGIEVLADRGAVLTAFQHSRVHEPLTGGGSSYRKSEPVDPELLDATSRLMASMDYTGVAMVEFRINQDLGEWVLVEINGRFWGSLPLAVSSGADFPFYLYQLLVDGKREFPQSYKTGIYCRNLVTDLGWNWRNLRADRSDPTLNTLPLRAVAGELKNVLTLHERSDTFVLDDLKVGFVELASLAGRAWRAISASLRRLFVQAWPVRRVYARRARRALATAPTVLFVCKGNICRSPFAHLYARSVLPPSVKVQSAGYYPEEGRSSPPEAIAVAKQKGVDLTEHRSTVISDSLVDHAQAIFIFDEATYRVIAERYPSAKPKTHYLGVLGIRGPVTIEDPYGRNVEAYSVAYDTIVRVLSSQRP